MHMLSRKSLATSPILLLVLFSCAVPTPSDQERISKLSAECQSEQSAGVRPIERESDVTGSEHFLLDKPSQEGAKKINYKATETLGETHYVSIDYSTRVFVECFLPSTNFAYVRVVQPDWLTEHRGWVSASVLTVNLAGVNESRSRIDGANKYMVTMDTRDTYQEQEVELTEISAPVCGDRNRPGIRGTGTIKITNPPQTIPLEIFPCVDDGEQNVKLPDGRVLYLRKALS